MVIFFSIIFSVCYAESMEYTLTDLYRITMMKSERIQISREDTTIAEKERERARSAFIPTISTFGGFNAYTADKRSGGTLIQPDNAASWGARVDISLSTGSKELFIYQIAKEEIEKSGHDLNAITEGNLFIVATSYYDLLRSRKILDIAKANLERVTKHRDAAAARLRVGEVTRTDLLRAEAEVSGAKSDLIRAENALRLSKSLLARFVGISGEFDVKEPPPESDALPDSVDLLKEKAFEERAEMKASDISKKIAEDRLKAAKSNYWPTLSAEGVYSRQESNPTDPFTPKESIWGGISINFPFFEGGLRVAETGQAEAKARQSALFHEDMKKTVGIEVESSWLDYQTQRGILQSLEDQLRFSTDNYYSISRQYEFGLANSIDVIDANTLLLTAERQLADAGFNYRLSLVRVQRTTGVLLQRAISDMTDEKPKETTARGKYLNE